ncbi:MAG: cobalamin-binding protein [Chloroflexi bacterium HGW-Chloroflexi-1]|nr:MAG: cobalamin-binding protein [Chloroflexi bacterium HGW-Chloroflexi-1]
MSSSLETIYNAVLEGNAPGAKAGVQAAITEGIAPETILRDGLIAAMGEVGRLFEENEYFVPEMLVAARAMQGGLALLKPHLAMVGAAPTGKVIVGTVKGDLHDIGKNLVAMMLEGAGFEIVDLGVDVSPDKFVKAVMEHKPQAIAMSALLTTTMPGMKNTIVALEEAGLRGSVKVMIGGAPVTDGFARQIGADGYSPDASSAVRLAKALTGA